MTHSDLMPEIFFLMVFMVGVCVWLIGVSRELKTSTDELAIVKGLLREVLSNQTKTKEAEDATEEQEEQQQSGNVVTELWKFVHSKNSEGI